MQSVSRSSPRWRRGPGPYFWSHERGVTSGRDRRADGTAAEVLLAEGGDDRWQGMLRPASVGRQEGDTKPIADAIETRDRLARVIELRPMTADDLSMVAR